MFKPPLDLAKARILISNDDGIHAPGLKVLEQAARALSRDVWVVAPETEQSGASHSLTLHRPLRIRRLGPRRFAVDGTPSDSVLLAINRILKDRRPALVLSGVNRGANLGEDVTYSGTIAAAMEATLLGVPAIALSQIAESDDTAKWPTAAAYIGPVVRGLTGTGWPRNVFINVNFPDIAADAVNGIRITRQGRRKLGDELVERRDPRGRPYYWIGAMRLEEAARPGTDIAAINAGAISVTPLYLDLTHEATIKKLKGAFA
ncbi:MAG: 5'/3'-nucleotidase SurE [Alphaproteobacteria bacterium]